MQAAEELRQSFAKRLSRTSFELSEMTTSTRVVAWATTPQATRKPDRERVRQAAIELWGTAGPPDHVSNLSICREVAQWLKKNDQTADIGDATDIP